ncbi:hypothetical protein PGT21_003730 [Puccinia graminis f. sp. tritici]|uniref:Secreted protein n=1 Tax=Puccinia graminis f. sp. tritici TaxID=56615 RepID=A0A5B0QSB0_PUCGR|nr:hypothetical protein PGT21_003730 [Puccinia graminis f. sp. tritici]
MQFSTLFVLSMMLLFLTHETCCFSWVCLGEGATVCSAPVTKSEKSRNRDLKDFWVSDAKGAGTNLFTCDDVLPGGHLATRGWCCIFKSLKSVCMKINLLLQLQLTTDLPVLLRIPSPPQTSISVWLVITGYTNDPP